MAQHLLDVRDLCISFVGRDGNALEAVNKLNLHIDAGEIVGVVGESGCGKSVFAQSVMRLLEHEQKMAYTGQILFDGEDLLARPLKSMREVRGCDIAMIFQDPLSSLNPVMTVGAQVVEAVRAHRKVSRREARNEALSLLERVGIRDAAARFDMYPGDFSGGMRQRVMIAMALACLSPTSPPRHSTPPPKSRSSTYCATSTAPRTWRCFLSAMIWVSLRASARACTSCIWAKS